MKNYITLFIVIILFGCDAPTEETRHGENLILPPSDKEIILEDNFSTWLMYEGNLPCEDCSGREVQLKLENSPEKKERAFELIETHLATKDGDRKFTKKGLYSIHYGIEKEPSIMVIRLLDENQQTFISFSQETNGSLQLLSGDEKRLVSDSSFILSKVP